MSVSVKLAARQQPHVGQITQRYIDLAGVLFRDEAELAEARMFGSASSTNE